MEEVRYLYQVIPKRPILGLSGIKCLKVPKSLSLTKEEVKLCLGKGSVYRRFANESKLVKVVPSTLDRLHNAKFMTEEEYAQFKSSELGDTGNVVVEIQSDKTTVSPISVLEEAAAESESTVEAVETQETSNEVVNAEVNLDNTESAESTVEAVETQETSNEVVNAEATSEPDTTVKTIEESKPATQSNNYQNNYKGKNKRR